MPTPEVAVANLVHSYAERIDLGDFDGLADLLADATITSEGTDLDIRGRAAVLALYIDGTRRYEDTGTPKTKHVTTNLIIEVDDSAGTATCRSYFTVLQAVRDSLPLQPIIAGRYHDRFVRNGDGAGGWRFDARHMIVDLVGDLSQHLLLDFGLEEGA
jgi:hypothetical protein